MQDPIIHTLANGASVLITSPGHGFRFSDGTTAASQHKDVCDSLTLSRTLRDITRIKGMRVGSVSMTLSDTQIAALRHLCSLADIVLIPFPVLAALREQGIRDQFPNALSFNATAETQRSAPQDKVVDIDNWSY